VANARFDAGEQALLDGLGASLRARGWDRQVTVERLLRDWAALASSVERYPLTVDDYTNDLCSRDGLALVLDGCPEPLRAKLAALVEEADRAFRAGTLEDAEGRLARYFRIGPESGWWWSRVPASGPLATYLGRAPSGS
jgi:hypothetical protein